MKEPSIYKVLVTDGLAPEGLEKMRGVERIDILDVSNRDRNTIEISLADADILIVRSRTQVDRELLDKAEHLKVVIRAGIGLDNIDIAAATDRGIVVMNAPTGNIVTTAEHTIAMMFAVSRHIPQADASLRQGRWEKSKLQGNELRGKTLGIVGLGNIGRAVAEIALPLRMKVIGFDPYVNEEAAARRNIRLVSFEELLTGSDYVTLHVPLTSSTKWLIGKDALGKMKKTAYLIQCARGGIVDEQALMRALEAKEITGAALDVFETEPLLPDHPFLTRSDVVLTPHLGASTDEAQTQVGLEVAQEVIQYIQAGVLSNAVNVPNLTSEQLSVIKPYLLLSEKLGGFVGQMAPSNIKRIRVHFEGEVSHYNRDVLMRSILKGFLTPLLSTTVNFVNARTLLKERGIRVEESSEEECADYSSLLEVSVEGNETLSCAGTIFGKEEPRIVRIDHFSIDAIPEGCLLFSRNKDLPGVIGAMGMILGNQGINIARMHLGRDPQKGLAIALINVDSKLPPETLEMLRKVRGMVSVSQIQL